MTIEPLISDYQEDADMRELLIEFCDSLQESCAKLKVGVENSDVEIVRRIAHQLKGAGGGYGYPLITEAGARIEDAVRGSDAIDDNVRILVAQLIHLCERARAGVA